MSRKLSPEDSQRIIEQIEGRYVYPPEQAAARAKLFARVEEMRAASDRQWAERTLGALMPLLGLDEDWTTYDTWEAAIAVLIAGREDRTFQFTGRKLSKEIDHE